jgi:hypothetical protein
VSHLVKIHGKAELLQSQQQQISSRQTIWRRKRKACELNSTDSNLEANPDHEVSFQDGFSSDEDACHPDNDCGSAGTVDPIPDVFSIQNQPEVVTVLSVQEEEYAGEKSCNEYDLFEDGSQSNESSSAEMSSSEDNSSDSESDTCTYDSSGSEENPVHDESPCVELTEQNQLCMMILSYLSKYKLSGNGSQDLINLLRIVQPNLDLQNLTLDKLKEILGNCDVKSYDYCEKCDTAFPQDETVIRCSTCNSLRFIGGERVTVVIEQQLKYLLERTGIWNNIQKNKVNVGKSKTIKDIIDGKEYLKHCQPGGFLHSPNNLSLIFNTDGIPLYKSSKVSLWPIFLAINELPPQERFAVKNMILWGIWQGAGKPKFSSFLDIFTDDLLNLKETGMDVVVNGANVKCKLMLLLGVVLTYQQRLKLCS